MTRRLPGGTVVIESTPPAPCAACGKSRELRPYGAGGAEICFPCAMATPESRAEAARRMAEMLGTSVPSTERSPFQA